MECVYCGKVFDKKQRGYRRQSFQSKLRDTEQSVLDAAIDVFDLSSPISPRLMEERALCNICCGLLAKITKRNKELSEFKDTLEKRAAQGSYFETRMRKRPTPTMEEGSSSESSHLHAPTKLTNKSAEETHVTDTRFLCFHCGRVFEKKSKGYKRHLFQSKVQGTEQSVLDAVIDVFDLSSPISPRLVEDRALCNICYGLLEKITKRNKELSQFKDALEKRAAKGNYFETRKRKRPTPTMDAGSSSHPHAQTTSTRKSAKKMRVTITPFVRPSFTKRVVSMIKRYDYYSAFKLLLSSSKAAHRDFVRFTKSKIRREVRSFLKGENMMMKSLTRDTAENFSWGSVLEETTNKVPVLQTVLEAAITTKHSYRNVQFYAKISVEI
ncbi:uncharacterized protein [Ptychodera flava]|uniref:uncharacterized protein n=1 Tax=Ptychodera flava TaxID=63121 RepID=UPI003969F166